MGLPSTVGNKKNHRNSESMFLGLEKLKSLLENWFFLLRFGSKKNCLNFHSGV